MTCQQRIDKIAELEQWLQINPNHPNRTIIESDLRKLKQDQLIEELKPLEMNSDAQQRLENLHTVLVFCSERQSMGKLGIFRDGERIYINQERGAILSQSAYQNDEIGIDQVRNYHLPPHIEIKVKLTLAEIEATAWDPLK